MNKKQNNAFSLIEALIILLLISVTIAGATPLITKKISLPKWSIVKNNNNQSVAINYGADSYDRVGIGQDLNPYQTAVAGGNPDTQAKLLVNDMIIKNSTPSDYTSVFLGTTKTGNNFFNSANYYPDSNSILVSTNVLNAANDWFSNMQNGIAIKTPNNVAPNPAGAWNAVWNNNINIMTFTGGNGTPASYIQTDQNAGHTATLNIGANSGATSIYLHQNDVTFKLASDVGADTDGNRTLKYNASTPLLSTNKILSASNGMDSLIMSNDRADEILSSVSDSDEVEKAACTPAGASQPFVRWKQQASFSYCTATSADGWWTTSDKRLKDIKADYTKGIKELSKLNTYYYTFKNDKKQTLYTGLIAQHLKGIFDIALRKNEKGYYSYEKNAILYAMINSVKSVNKKQNDIAKAQKDTNEEADRLIRMYK